MLGYFGPEGTFTHQALLSLALDEEAIPFPSVAATLDAFSVGPDLTCGAGPPFQKLLVQRYRSLELSMSAACSIRAAVGAGSLHWHDRQFKTGVGPLLAHQK